MKSRTSRQSLQRPDRLPPRTPLTPEEISALKDLVQYNKTQCAALVEQFHYALDGYTAIQQRMKANRNALVSSLQIVCAWCQQTLVWQRVQTPTPLPISYSICAHCYADVTRNLDPITASTASTP